MAHADRVAAHVVVAEPQPEPAVRHSGFFGGGDGGMGPGTEVPRQRGRTKRISALSNAQRRSTTKAPSHVRQSTSDLDEQALREIYRDLDSMGTEAGVNNTADSQRSHRFIIEPLAPWRLCWDTFTFVVIAYQVMIIPVDLSFLDPGTVSTKFSVWWWIEVWTGIFFMADICVICLTAFVRDNGVCVRNQTLILRNYICEPPWFAAMDLLSILPFVLLFLEATSRSSAALAQVTKTTRFMRYVRLLRMLRLLRITRAVKIFRHLTGMVMVGGTWVALFSGLMELLLAFLFLSHMGACAWKALVDFERQATNEGIDMESMWECYSFALWWTTSMLAANQPPTPPGNVYEMWVYNVFTILSVAALSIGIGVLVELVERFAEAGQDLRHKLHITHSFFARCELPEVLKAKVLGAIRAAAKHEREQGKFKQLVEPLLSHDLLQQLHGNIHGTLIRRFPPFQDEEVPARFLYRLAYEAHVRRYIIGDLIMEEGKVGRSMVFIIEGRAVIRSVAQRLELPIVGPGWWLGEKVLFWTNEHGSERPTRAASLRALTACTALEILVEHFERAVEDYKLQNWLKRMQARGVAGEPWGCPCCGEADHWLADCEKVVDNFEGTDSMVCHVAAETFTRSSTLMKTFPAVPEDDDVFVMEQIRPSLKSQRDMAQGHLLPMAGFRSSLSSSLRGSVTSAASQEDLLVQVLVELREAKNEVAKLREKVDEGAEMRAVAAAARKAERYQTKARRRGDTPAQCSLPAVSLPQATMVGLDSEVLR